MSTGDKRYLGDVFINQENYERQKQFFRDIIDSYQYKYGGTFDAATLQGTVPSDYATKEQGEKADNAILSPLRLGRKEIVNIEDSQYIFTDAVLLDRQDGRLNAIDWYNNLEDDNVTDALEAIYNQCISIQEGLQDNIDLKLDTSEYQDFFENDYMELKNNVSDIFEEFTDEHGDIVKKLNAQLVNGLRFILITQDKYNQLTETEKTYWRNVYIIKDASEIPPEYADPMMWELTDGYTFALNDGMLQVTNGLSDTWKDICSLDDLLVGADFDSLIENYVQGEDYIIENTSLQNSIMNISSNTVDENQQNYPFLSSSLKDDFVKTISVNNSQTNVQETLTNGFKTVNLDIDTIVNNTLNDTLNNTINPLITDINDTISAEQAKVSAIQDEMPSIRSSLSTAQNKNSNQDQRLDSIEQQLTSINATLSSIQNNINKKFTDLNTSLGTWITLPSGTNSDTYYFANTTLKLVLFRFYAMISSDTSSYKPIPGIAKIPNGYIPRYTTYFPLSYGYNNDIHVALGGRGLSDSSQIGKFLYRSKAGAKSNNVKDFYVSGIYTYW